MANFCDAYLTCVPLVSIRADRFLTSNALTTLPEGVFEDLGSDGSLKGL